MGGAAGQYLTSSLPWMWRGVPGEEDDTVSVVSELKAREWMEEQEAGTEKSDGEEPPLFLPTPDFMASAGEG